MANAQGVAQTCMIPLEHEVPDSEICAAADLVIYLGKKHGTKKRSKRCDHKSIEAYTLLDQDQNLYQEPEGELCPEVEVSGYVANCSS